MRGGLSGTPVAVLGLQLEDQRLVFNGGAGGRAIDGRDGITVAFTTGRGACVLALSATITKSKPANIIVLEEPILC